MYDQEIDRNLALSYQRLKTMERRHIDWMKRTRNFRAWNERIETGVLVKSRKREKVSVEMRVGECCQWKATGQCSRGDSHSFSQTSNRGQKAQSNSPAPKAQTWNVSGEKVLLDGKVRKRVLTEVLKCPHRNVYEFVVYLWFIKITNPYRDANSATNVCSDTRRLREGISCLTERVYTVGLRVPRYRASEQVYCTEGSNRAVTYSNGTWDPIKIRE